MFFNLHANKTNYPTTFHTFNTNCHCHKMHQDANPGRQQWNTADSRSERHHLNHIIITRCLRLKSVHRNAILLHNQEMKVHCWIAVYQPLLHSKIFDFNFLLQLMIEFLKHLCLLHKMIVTQNGNVYESNEKLSTENRHNSVQHVKCISICSMQLVVTCHVKQPAPPRHIRKPSI